MAKILVVDDSVLARRVLRSYLEDAGHEVIEAGDGISALEQNFLHKPQLILLDMTMRGLQGLEVLHQVRLAGSEVPIVVATADIQASTRAMATGAGANGFITKPFSEEAVMGIVQILLGDHACYSTNDNTTHLPS